MRRAPPPAVDTFKPPLEEFVRHPAVKPRENLGECDVEVCHRQRQYARACSCKAHHLRWKATPLRSAGHWGRFQDLVAPHAPAV
ncbi:hypothetical protein SGFS_056030 [Streptomyces graminofaciens]|uniref:Uncharacterized protein n=1 Tax=Streptomyces graminofaciens TaxID=68212 RepID=A0ABM7FDY7_9ACTN|nr:hypothetical protein SGFS_056030 [Streptomyces graminofaciens]